MAALEACVWLLLALLVVFFLFFGEFSLIAAFIAANSQANGDLFINPFLQMKRMQRMQNVSVAKFGGTSLSSAETINLVRSKLVSNRDICIGVFSAPGKTADDKVKITDRLIAIRNAGKPLAEHIDAIEGRFSSIEQGLGIARKNGVSQLVGDEIVQRLQMNDDSLVAIGEFLNAQLMATYLNETGIPARFVSPHEISFMVNKQNGIYAIDRSLYETIGAALQQLLNGNEILVVPGFYGHDASHAVRTFARGGSDYTGAVIAAALHATYFNYTDIDGIKVVEPEVFATAKRIQLMTHRELFELTAGGAFGVFQHEAVQPLLERNVTTHVLNTFSESEGTAITGRQQNNGRHEVAGIVSRFGNRVCLVGERMGDAIVDEAVAILNGKGTQVRKVVKNGVSRTIEIANGSSVESAREIYLNLVHQ